MIALRYERRWRILSLLLLLLALGAALMPAVWFWNDMAQAADLLADVDKWIHAMTFFVLSLWFAGLYRRSSYWKIALGLLMFGIIIEVCQRMVSYRTADLADVGADVAGIVAGLFVALLGLGGWCQRAEAWLLRRAS